MQLMKLDPRTSWPLDETLLRTPCMGWQQPICMLTSGSGHRILKLKPVSQNLPNVELHVRCYMHQFKTDQKQAEKVPVQVLLYMYKAL